MARLTEYRRGEWLALTSKEVNQGMVKCFLTSTELWTITEETAGFFVERKTRGGEQLSMTKCSSLKYASDYVLWEN